MDKEPIARAVSTAAARACSACGAWPCICAALTDGPMEFSIRTETCACGGRIRPVGGSSDNVGTAIRFHAASERHQRWRKRAGIE